MRISIATILFTLLGLSSTTPTPTSLIPRCGTTLYPTFMQQLLSFLPDTVFPTTNDFEVSLDTDLNGETINRISQIVAFQNIPDTAYGCQLNIIIPPPSASFLSYGFPILNIYSLYDFDFEEGINWPNDWSWDSFYPEIEDSGAFGEAFLVFGESVVVNAEVCEGDFAFVFEIARWVGVSSGVEFEEVEAEAGVFLSFDC
jgi:hypothetical protein